MEIHKLEDKNRGLYTVDGSLHPRKDLQLVKGNVIKAPTKTKAQQKQHDIQDKVGKSLNNPEVKDLVGIKTKKETKEILESGRKTRACAFSACPRFLSVTVVMRYQRTLVLCEEQAGGHTRFRSFPLTAH